MRHHGDVRVTRRAFGGGHEAYVVDGPPGHSFTVIPYGAHLVEVVVPDRGGRSDGVVLGFDDVASYRDHRDRYFGSTIGRFANRIGAGCFELDGRIHRLEANEGPNTLHGGPDGFSAQTWSVAETDAGDGVRLGYRSPAGEGGFPGTVQAHTTYAWRGTRLVVTHEATTDAPTVVSMTNHAYWNLGGSLAQHRLLVAAGAVLEVDDARIPSGGLDPLDGSSLDLRHEPELGEVIARTGGVDHCYVLDAADGRVASLWSPETGRRMDVRTDQPALVVYTANDAGPFPPHSAVCLEAHGYPDAPNHRHFPSTRLGPGEVYRSRTEYRFTAG